MNKNFIIAGGMLLGVMALIVLLYVLSAVTHKIPTNTALIIGAVIAVPDAIIALFFLMRAARSDE